MANSLRSCVSDCLADCLQETIKMTFAAMGKTWCDHEYCININYGPAR